ncbi:MAG TPA: antitoxin, partial [Leptospiraceae bacterium]|nr:antitoxin [Leptospiraceae bacterium]
EAGEWKSVKNLKEWNLKLKKAASATLIKDARMNIRIHKRDLQLLKVKALEEGMPYQTLVSSILHKYVTGKLKEI